MYFIEWRANHPTDFIEGQGVQAEGVQAESVQAEGQQNAEKEHTRL